MFETFDYDKFEIENEKYKDPERSSIYLFERGKKLWVNSRFIYEIPIYPYFYLSYKEFYEHPDKPSTIKLKGKYFGDINLGSNGGVEIGYWYYFDETGKLIKEVDEDKKFGKFSYNEVLKFLDSKKDINLNTGEGRDKFEVQFYYSNKSTKKLWKVFVKIGEPQDGPPPLGYKYEKGETISYSYQKGKTYYLDGNTGEQIKTSDKRLLDYKEIIPHFEEKFPKLIESTAIYKTHEGKDYTQTEWKIFEQEQFNEHLRKTGREDLIKTVEKAETPKTESTRKSLFLAEEGDVKPQKKKSFLGGLFS